MRRSEPAENSDGDGAAGIRANRSHECEKAAALRLTRYSAPNPAGVRRINHKAGRTRYEPSIRAGVSYTFWGAKALPWREKPARLIDSHPPTRRRAGFWSIRQASL